MPRRIIVTSALPYANGPIHIGHLVEYLQTDMWVRYHKMCGSECLYFCADDTHGTPIMISARAEGIKPEQLIERVGAEHKEDFDDFLIEFDNYYSTHSPENRQFSEWIFDKLNKRGSIARRTVEQTYCENCGMFLPDRYVRGTCPICKAEDQYGDSCDRCGGTYQPVDLINPRCATCQGQPSRRKSEHYFFKLVDFEDDLKKLIAGGYTQQSVANKLDEWFETGLKDWDISRDGPYFGFEIPGETDKFFYVWLDAPVGYMASAKNYCDRNGLDFKELWNGEASEIYHFIGKDIMYFHALFWPAMLIGSDFRPAKKLFVHGFLTVDGQKMSKSKGTFIKAKTYLRHLEPEYLRYYYASKLTGGVEDIDLSLEDFVNKTNSNLVGKFANLLSRSVPMLTKKLDGRLGQLDQPGRELIETLRAAKGEITGNYEGLNYAAAVRKITSLADEANRYVEQNQPWVLIKTEAEKTRAVLTAVINAARLLTIYLKPILPGYAGKVEKMLNIEPLTFADAEKVLEGHKVNEFERLVDRIDMEKVNAMIEETKEGESPKPEEVEPIEPIQPEITIDDFAKCDLRIAKVLKAETVDGADRLLHLQLDLGGGVGKSVFAGIALAYRPEELEGKMVICLANLKPRKMKFGLSEAMILAAGPGRSDIFMLSVDAGAKPGQRVS